MQNDVEITNFYFGGSENFTEQAKEAEKKIQRLLDDGYIPKMQLTCNEDYSIWAFIKEHHAE